MKDWDEVVAVACALPDVEMASFYGALCPKVNGKAFVSPGREQGSFCLLVSMDEKLLLMETDPATFWETDHYRNYPAILVRFGTDAHERIRTYIQRAWWDRAKKVQRQAFGDRP
ncbi:MmcQ/YjbR family DNA-binding protein [Sphingomonas cavernae]|uniref:MmcQ/YjbR family DNA-binding protein n=1 Tax=Sphingomonas cavernae TaxID=2320861 RepID=A0A418W715_9SPHN|nr:hypothetical protein [Sphingomonas cavernae]RJF85835.1 hypothetical protein D3876_18355 [Sphingomonas cavernae]